MVIFNCATSLYNPLHNEPEDFTVRALPSVFLLGLALSFAPLSSWASRQITDQLGRQVTLPDKVDRVVVLQHQTLNLLGQLDATDDIVGVLNNWQQQLGSGYVRLAPALEKTPVVGDLPTVNLESVVALHPQVVFVTNYAPQEMIDQISQTGI